MYSLSLTQHLWWNDNVTIEQATKIFGLLMLFPADMIFSERIGIFILASGYPWLHYRTRPNIGGGAFEHAKLVC